jgi:hypothetical protein
MGFGAILRFGVFASDAEFLPFLLHIIEKWLGDGEY